MSALGQKRTLQSVRPMPLYPRKRTSEPARALPEGSLAIFAAIRRASSFVSSLAADRVRLPLRKRAGSDPTRSGFSI